MIPDISKMVVVAPHPDDEILGVGGTIRRAIKFGIDVSILFVSGHLPPLYPPENFEITRREAEKAMNILGVSAFHFLEVPATLVSDVPVAKLNKDISSFIMGQSPDAVFIPFPDRHIDHRIIFDASLVACRPNTQIAPKLVMAYETLSETHWNAPGIEPAFVPEVFIDITSEFADKKKALSCYESQIKGVGSRSLDAVEALAKFRGSQNGFLFAEAFKLVRLNV